MSEVIYRLKCNRQRLLNIDFCQGLISHKEWKKRSKENIITEEEIQVIKEEK